MDRAIINYKMLTKSLQNSNSLSICHSDVSKFLSFNVLMLNYIEFSKPEKATEYKIDYKMYGLQGYALNAHQPPQSKSHNVFRAGPSSSASGFDAARSTTQFPGASNFTSVIDYQLGTMLGQGNYAQVKQATHKSTGYIVAIKIYDKFRLSANAQVRKSVQREIKLLGELSSTDKKYNTSDGSQSFAVGHPNIMKLYDAIDTARQLYLILENVEG